MNKKQYRIMMSSELIVLTSEKLLKIFFQKVSNQPKKYKIEEAIITVETKQVLDEFDFAVLCAIMTLYEEYGMLTLFKPLNILKLITGNSKAHFAESSKKANTISEKMIMESIHHLQQFKITIGSSVHKLIHLDKNDDYLTIVERPWLISCYENEKNFLCLKKIVLDIRVMRFQVKNGYIHQSKDIIIFKFWLLNQILNSKENLSLEIKYIFEKLKVQESFDLLEQKLLCHTISYEIYRKRRNQAQSRVRKLIKGYLKTLIDYKIIKKYSIGKLQVYVVMNNTI